MTEEFTLPRTGTAPLRFRGDPVASATSHVVVNGGALENRWHELAVYRTAAGKWVAAVRFRSRWQGEHDHDAAQVFDAPAELVDWLTHYSPRDHWQGFPAGEAYAEKQRRVEDAIRAGYQRAVSEVLAALPEAAEEIG